ncbi:exodeoxyribonuclease V subunit alpha [Geotalea sp. SG265]|uniref:exodeoxyribonuclease V subunit alpha n=1 Tax=Geotalea sp. SG265 TaxID=2922867 RepID=UPI001FAF7609|nr:exodeoxyribonuclease V subunit alpha [Geotalea sp. SG265]
MNRDGGMAAMADSLSFSHMDRHFASFVCRLAGTDDYLLWLATALASQAVSNGNVCLDLANAAISASAAGYAIDDPAAWSDHLRKWPVVGAPGEFTPLVLDSADRLYLHRYWSYETSLAKELLRRALQSPPFDRELLAAGMKRLFPSPPAEETDWQQVAALACISRSIAVIAGGPGTGKTSTVFRVLILLVEQAAGSRCHIALAAPTGKAAARLGESIAGARQGAAISELVLQQIPDQVMTLHRLLGFVPGSNRFRYNRDNPLPYDVVVVDEASMVSLPLMAKLVDALRDSARLILLGDRDQLASVEAGAVLGDICNTGGSHCFSAPFTRLAEETIGTAPARESAGETVHPLNDSIVVLRRSYRFGAESGIGTLSRLVNGGNGTAALEVLTAQHYADLAFRDNPGAAHLEEALTAAIIDGFQPYLTAGTPEGAFAALDRFRILCPLRQGPFGTEAVNRLVAKVLAGKGLIHPQGRWYAGQPVMVTRNDYSLRLFNGDMGIILPDPAANNELRAFFATGEGTLKSVLPLRLPEHETAFAMTVHKSQGSEFDRILLLLPDRHSEVLTRELIYTALTRAKHAVEICGSGDVFVRATASRTVRSSGLRDALWGKA